MVMGVPSGFEDFEGLDLPDLHAPNKKTFDQWCQKPEIIFIRKHATTSTEALDMLLFAAYSAGFVNGTAAVAKVVLQHMRPGFMSDKR